MTAVEADGVFDDDDLSSIFPGPPVERSWRHPSELHYASDLAVAAPTTGSPRRIFAWSFGAAVAVSVAASVLATVLVSSRAQSEGQRAASLLYPITTIDQRIQQLFTLVVRDGAGQRSVPALVLDRLGTMVTSWTGINQASSISQTPNDQGVQVERLQQSSLALVRGTPTVTVSPLGSCRQMHVGTPLQVTTTNTSTTGHVTSTGMAPLDGNDEPTTPVVIIQTDGTADVTDSVVWSDGKIVAIGISKNDNGDLVAIPTDVAIGLARTASDQSPSMPWLGIGGANVGDGNGATITTVVDGSPAQGQLDVGDTIVAIDGDAIDSMWSLAVALRRYTAKDTIELRVLRNGVAHFAAVTLSAKNASSTSVAPPTTQPPPAVPTSR